MIEQNYYHHTQWQSLHTTCLPAVTLAPPPTPCHRTIPHPTLSPAAFPISSKTPPPNTNQDMENIQKKQEEKKEIWYDCAVY
jgi:hypothetical protein